MKTRENTTLAALMRLLAIMAVFVCLPPTTRRAGAACNAPGGMRFTGVLDVSPRPNNRTVHNAYTPEIGILVNTALGWFQFGKAPPFDKSVITRKFLVCCPQTIPEPGYGVWEVVFHSVYGTATLSPSFGPGKVPEIINKVVGAAAGSGVAPDIVTQLQSALESLSLTFAGVNATWSVNSANPESARDDCNGCAYNTRWTGSEDAVFQGTVGSYNNTSWAGGTVLAISVTLVDADVNINWRDGLVSGIAYKWRTTSSTITTSWQFGLGPLQTHVWVSNPPATVTEDKHAFCSASRPPSP